MKVRAWLIGVALIGCILALGVLYVACDLWLAKAQIDAWSQVKYNPMPWPAELPIEIVGQEFEWRIRYPSRRRLQNDHQLVENFAREASANQGQADDLHLVNELHLWKGGKVQIYLKSADVAHSFFLPMMRLRQDVIPGKVTDDVWLAATESNVSWDPQAADWRVDDEWEFVCADHSRLDPKKMRGQLFVHETKAEFLRWLEGAEKLRDQPRRGP